MLTVMEEESLRDDSDERHDYYVWERYIADCIAGNGRLCSRWHFHANMRMLKKIMVEWTKVEPGEKHGAHTIERHTRNSFTSYVELQVTSDTPGIKILRNIRFLFEGTNATTLYRAYM